ncbi:hypothetical protein P152DRAFT_221823 [Eremomyces bilateralis CBS 781.70]|uniref:RING-type domain-containing protein n=1 Tax=Eremomyces bilateralis CBS 781.70 TaxID=1392243 RepID=A0A6G1FRX7_9PEZI|nr:uncharacterized protein P152DRAFT_221823 [Eremomyces bilateralis CBS 781.70]KAF1808429.1 hypothetical protein P152DRAFT_221823 [Eremomyces bilateralis CBS 781.70]
MTSIDLLSLFKIPTGSTQRCIGYARSTSDGSCGNRVKRYGAEQIIEQSLAEPLSKQKLRQVLVSVAKASLCGRYHKDQAIGIVYRWEARIRMHCPELIEHDIDRDTSIDADDASADTVYQSIPNVVELTVPTGDQIDTVTDIPADTSTQQTPLVSQCGAHCQRRSTDEDCPICTSLLANAPLSSLTWCKVQCGHNLHAECMEEWLGSHNNGPSCVVCRSPWLPPCEHETAEPPFSIWTQDASASGLARLFDPKNHGFNIWNEDCRMEFRLLFSED